MTTLDIAWADAARTLLVVRRGVNVFNVPADPDNADYAAIAAEVDVDALPAPAPVAAGPMPGGMVLTAGPGTPAPGEAG